MQQKSIEWNQVGGSGDGWRGDVVRAGGARGPTPLARDIGFSHFKGRGAETGQRASGDGERRIIILASGSPGKGAEVGERDPQECRVSAPSPHHSSQGSDNSSQTSTSIFVSCRLTDPLEIKSYFSKQTRPRSTSCTQRSQVTLGPAGNANPTSASR